MTGTNGVAREAVARGGFRASALYRPHYVERGMAMLSKAVGRAPNGRLGLVASRIAWRAIRHRALGGRLLQHFVAKRLDDEPNLVGRDHVPIEVRPCVVHVHVRSFPLHLGGLAVAVAHHRAQRSLNGGAARWPRGSTGEIHR